MELKPRLANNIAMILGGGVLSLFGLPIAMDLGGYLGLIPGAFGLLGVFWILAGGIAIARRSRMAINITDAGIELPAPRVFQKASRRVLLLREEIATISKHESLKGRLIEIGMKDGTKMQVQARHYCELDEFISHCRSHGF